MSSAPSSIGVLLNGLVLMNVSAYIQQIIIGHPYRPAVAFDTFASPAAASVKLMSAESAQFSSLWWVQATRRFGAKAQSELFGRPAERQIVNNFARTSPRHDFRPSSVDDPTRLSNQAGEVPDRFQVLRKSVKSVLESFRWAEIGRR